MGLNRKYNFCPRDLVITTHQTLLHRLVRASVIDWSERRGLVLLSNLGLGTALKSPAIIMGLPAYCGKIVLRSLKKEVGKPARPISVSIYQLLLV